MTSDSLSPQDSSLIPDLKDLPPGWADVASIIMKNQLVDGELPTTDFNTPGGDEPLDTPNRMRKDLGEPYKALDHLDEIRNSLGESGSSAESAQGNPEQLGLSLEGDEDFKAYFAEAVHRGLQGRQPKVILYPGCGNHVSPAAVFEDARTIFVDENPDITHEFVQYNANNPEKLEFYRSDMHKFVMPGGVRADVVFLYNTDNMTEPELDRVVAPNGLVIVNLGFEDELYMQTCPGYEFVSMVPYMRDGEEEVTNSLHVFRRKESNAVVDN